jgi:hypothetical protein
MQSQPIRGGYLQAPRAEQGRGLLVPHDVLRQALIADTDKQAQREYRPLRAPGNRPKVIV